jgi:proteasome accessory factor C
VSTNGTAGGAGPAHRTTASDRFMRLLTVVPWIAGQDGPTLDEVCERFGMSRKQLLEDLQVVPLVGLPPYTPDTLIDVTVEGDRVWLRFADMFARPLRLTPEQGLALVAAGAAWSDLPGADAEGPLATALAKVARVLDIDPRDAVSVALAGRTRPGLLDTLRRAVADHRRVRLDYYTYGADRRTTRDVDPYAVFADEGAWYVRGYCHLATAERLFRVDRINEAELLDVTFPAPPAGRAGASAGLAGADGGRRGRGGEVFAPGPDVPRVTLDLAPAARWVVEAYPVDDVTEREGGWLRVRLAVSARPWLERLLLRLGPHACLVDADGADLLTAGPDVARRILRRYGRAMDASPG